MDPYIPKDAEKRHQSRPIKLGDVLLGPLETEVFVAAAVGGHPSSDRDNRNA